MIARVGAIWRHPIKAHGRERVDRVTVAEGSTIPWDRRWAVAHEASSAPDTGWSPCPNFTRAAKAPQLMAISATSDMGRGTVTLRHPARPDLTFDPDAEAAEFLDWVRPLMPENRAAPARIVRQTDRGLTDSDFASISLVNRASHADFSRSMGRDLDVLRWRGNIVLDGLDPWAEAGWIGKTLQIGTAQLCVREPITRCLATTANPNTGERDADTLGALKSYRGNHEFGVCAIVTQGGEIAVGDSVEPL
ncbi:MAG: MOSC domain-containing protein [Rhodobacterales bacterium]|nr:MOSC domain-containing protein [Rhodobacterales bacterium]